jgi:hypothetical protein
MNRRFFGLQSALLGVLLIGIGSCKKDPTASGVGNPAGLSLEFTARTLAVADSVHTFAILRDQVGTPLDVTVSLATGCTPGIVSVTPVSDAPQLRTGFFVKALAYGTSCVVATADGFTDTMTITAVPAAIVVTGVTGTTTTDTANSGDVVTYAYQYRDAKGVAVAGVPAPTVTTSDTTIAKAGATVGQVGARAPGLVTITITGAASVTTSKALTVRPIAFTGTTTGLKTPGSFLVIHRNGAAPVFDANTAVSLGAVDSASRSADSIMVLTPDLDAAGSHNFTVTGVGASDVAYIGSYVAVDPPAFTGTFTPNPMQSGVALKIARGAADVPFDTLQNRFFIGLGSPASLGTLARSGFKPDTITMNVSDLKAGGTYYVQFTRLGPTRTSWRGTVTLPAAVWGGTITPNSGKLDDRVVLRRGGGDPLFDADTRVFLNGVRALVESFSTDTAVVAIPAIEATGSVDLRITHMDATQLTVEGAGAFNSTSSGRIDVFDHANDQPDAPTPITANGVIYATLSGGCSPGAYEGVPSVGADDCDDYYILTNNTGVGATVTLTITWNPGTDVTTGNRPDIDFIRCLAPVGAFPQCGNFTDHSDEIGFGGATGADPETSTFSLPANSSRLIWVNMFDAKGASATPYQIKVSGLP